MTQIQAIVAAFTARQHGLVTRAQLVAAGVSVHLVDRLVRAGVLVAVHPGVYRHVAVPYTQELRWMAAVLAGGQGAALSHRAAAALHGFDLRRSRPEIVLPHGRKLVLPGVTVHRTRQLASLDVVTAKGIVVTSRPRTLLDMGTVRRGEPYRQLVQDAVVRRLVGVESLLGIVDRAGGHGKDGTGELRSALRGGLVDKKVESRLELLLARITDDADVPAPVRQHETECVDGRRVRLDQAWPDIRVAIDVDGRRWHGTASQARRTRDRSRSIVRSGWVHLVYGWSECVEAAGEVRAEIEATVLPLLRRAA